MLAVYDVADSPDRKAERKADGDHIEVAQAEALAADVDADRHGDEDDPAVQGEAADTEPSPGIGDISGLDQVEQPGARSDRRMAAEVSARATAACARCARPTISC